MNAVEPRKGVKTRLFGVVIIFLGAMDSMLSWRGGFAAGDTYFPLIALGFLIFAVGVIRGGRRSQTGAR